MEELDENELEQLKPRTEPLQDAFVRHHQEFAKKSQARVEKAKEKRSQTKPRVNVKQFGKRSSAKTGQKRD